MAPILFADTLTLDGKTYEANRVPDPQLFGRVLTPTRGYSPKVASNLASAAGVVQLDPAVETTWHRGAGASRPVAPGMYAWTKNGWPCDPGILMPGPLVTQVPMANYTAAVPVRGVWEQDGDLWAIAGRFVNRFAGGSSAPTIDQDLGPGIVGVAARLDLSGIILSTGYSGSNIWQRPAGGSWNETVPSGAGVKRGQIATVYWTSGGVVAERLVGQSSANGLRYTNAGDPRVDANWTPGVGLSDINVGPYPIQTFVTTLDHLYVVTTGGVRDLDVSGMAPQLTPEAEQLVMSTNGQASLAANGFIYANYGYGLLRVTIGSNATYAATQWVTPMVGLPNETPVSGYGTAIVRRGDWLIYSVYDPTANTSYVCWGREAKQDEPGPMTWHVAPIVLSGQKITAMWISGLVAANPRLWMFTIDNSSVVNAWWAPLALATPYQDIRQGRAYRCATSFDFYSTAEDWGDSSIPKDLEEQALEGEAISSSSSLALSVAPDNSPAYTSIGTYSQGDRTVLPVSLTPLLANRVQTKISGTGLSATPPILRKREQRAFAVPDQRQTRLYQLRIGRQTEHAGGSFEGSAPDERISHLESLQALGSRVSLVDERGYQATVKLLPGSLKFVEVEDANNDVVLMATCNLIVLASGGGAGSSMALDTLGALDSPLWRLD